MGRASAKAARLHPFGVRHHGPGGARSLVRALDALDPEMVLIEGPAEATPMLGYARDASMVPPVALLTYAEARPKHAVFHPFAEWSPEWQALRWALAHDRPVRLIDLPATHRLAESLAKEDAESEGGEEEAEAKEDPAEPPPSEPAVVDETGSWVRADPIGALAEVAGYQDGESWWNQLVEEHEHAPEIFGAIELAMTTLRAVAGEDEDLHEQQREAHMRLACSKALNETAGPVAAVVGAWHVPALKSGAKAADDRALLRGLPKTKVTVTWVPWTYTRLARASGYGAGVVAPGWYDHLWRARGEGVVTGWLVKAARLLRAAGLDASTAALIEAERLAVSLAALDEVALPGLDTITEALKATLCAGEDLPLRLIHRELHVGQRIGAVGDAIPQNPLAQDLIRQQKATRLKPEALERSLGLDLRSESGLARSTLLHRLSLLRVDWGHLEDAGGSRGTFRERWILRWDPECNVALAENLVYGTTVEAAAAGRAEAQALESSSLAQLSELVQSCLLSDLDAAARACVARLQAQATAGADVPGLMGAVVPLASVLRYGTARRIPVEALSLLIRSLVEQAVAGLVHACRNLDDDVAEDLRAQLEAFDQALVILDTATYLDHFDGALLRVAEDPQATALLQGFAVRRLYDRARVDPEVAAGHLGRALSPSVDPPRAGAWLEGFLARSGAVLLYDPKLLEIIDSWLVELEEESLVALLPVIRRAFSTLEGADRRLLMERLRAGPAAPAPAETSTAGEEAFRGAWPLYRVILGWEEAS